MAVLNRTAAVFAGLLIAMPVRAQFSPGELSRPHAHLEGTTQCASCHDVGKEISGKKCLVCHKEIAGAIAARRGFHFSASDRKTCAACHKEHLGREASPTVFTKSTFDHAATGFLLTGKHTKVECADCHAAKNIHDEAVLKIVRESKRSSYLGLTSECNSCHADRHNGTVGTACRNCHDVDGWKPARGFDHARARFALSGEHAKVACAKCHPGMQAQPDRTLFATAAFTDCTPCHASPHREKFAGSACSSCHRPEGWKQIAETRFNHDRTGFRLAGRHAGLRCDQCHRAGVQGAAPGGRKRLSTACEGCHEDIHRGQFAAGRGSDCSRCHTERGFVPANFNAADHARSRFALTGAHLAVPCRKCHAGEAGVMRFRFAALSCETCHQDPHGGQFAGNAGTPRTCESCHSTEDWRRAAFDHATTGFALAAKHATVACTKCHTSGFDRARGGFRKPSRECESCHRDAHGGQFASGSGTPCARCHTPAGWPELTFDHQTQSTFSLTGAHASVPCRSCHTRDTTVQGGVVRYKFTPAQCESCHSQKRIGNG